MLTTHTHTHHYDNQNFPTYLQTPWGGGVGTQRVEIDLWVTAPGLLSGLFRLLPSGDHHLHLAQGYPSPYCPHPVVLWQMTHLTL